MYISVVTLFVEDIDRAVDFYTSTLGWTKTMDEPMGEDRWVTVAPAGHETMFTLSTEKPIRSAEMPGMSGVILEVDDVQRTYDELSKKGVEFTQTPQAMPWGGWAMFRDSEGNVHGVHSPVAASVSAN